MGTVTLTKLITSYVAPQLQDTGFVRWSKDELTEYFNQGLRDLVTRFPEANVVDTTAFDLAAGIIQTLPAGGIRLGRVHYNTNAGAATTAIRRVSASMLNAVMDEWVAATATDEIIEYMHDPRQPTKFLVYPPSTGTRTARVTYSAIPTLLLTNTEANAVTPTPVVWGNQTIPVDDVFAEPLGHFVLHRAFNKEAEWARDEVRAAKHFTAYTEALGAMRTTNYEFSQETM